MAFFDSDNNNIDELTCPTPSSAVVVFSSTLNVQIFCTNVVFYAHITREKLQKRRFVRKICALNVDEIDTCCCNFNDA